MIGVLFRVESSKQPWSRGGGEGRDASSLWQAGRGGEAPETKGTSAAAAGRARMGCPQKSAPGGVIWSPRARTADFQRHIVFFVLCRTLKVLFPSFSLLHAGLKNSPEE